MAAGVGVHRQALELGAPAAPGHLQGVEDHRCAHVGGDAPADDEAAERVDDQAHVGGAGAGGDRGEVGDPQPVRGRCGEVAAHQIAGALRAGGGLGGAHPALAGRPGDAGGAHQPGDLVAADVMAGPAGRRPELAGPVDPPVGRPDRHQRRSHRPVAASPLRLGPRLGVVIRRRGELQSPPDRLDPELAAVGVDEPPPSSVWAVELRREESRRRLQDRVRPAKLAHLLLQGLDPGPLLAGDTRDRAVVDIGLAHPGPHRPPPRSRAAPQPA